MGVEVQNLWKELKTDFSNATETELRGALCRAQHFQKLEVTNLRPQEAEIKNWLNQKGIKYRIKL